ncbi:MAG: hypothetical protein ACP5UD_07300 [Conexivisphaera sp.]
MEEISQDKGESWGVSQGAASTSGKLRDGSPPTSSPEPPGPPESSGRPPPGPGMGEDELRAYLVLRALLDAVNSYSQIAGALGRMDHGDVLHLLSHALMVGNERAGSLMDSLASRGCLEMAPGSSLPFSMPYSSPCELEARKREDVKKDVEKRLVELAREIYGNASGSERVVLYHIALAAAPTYRDYDSMDGLARLLKVYGLPEGIWRIAAPILAFLHLYKEGRYPVQSLEDLLGKPEVDPRPLMSSADLAPVLRAIAMGYHLPAGYRELGEAEGLPDLLAYLVGSSAEDAKALLDSYFLADPARTIELLGIETPRPREGEAPREWLLEDWGRFYGLLWLIEGQYALMYSYHVRDDDLRRILESGDAAIVLLTGRARLAFSPRLVEAVRSLAQEIERSALELARGHEDEVAFALSWNCYGFGKPVLPQDRRLVLVVQACDRWSRRNYYPAFGDEDLQEHDFVVLSPRLLGFSRIPSDCRFGEKSPGNCGNLTGEESLYVGLEEPPGWVVERIGNLKVEVRKPPTGGVTPQMPPTGETAKGGAPPVPAPDVLTIVFGQNAARLFGGGAKIVLLQDQEDNPAMDLLVEATARIIRESDGSARWARFGRWDQLLNEYLAQYDLVVVEVNEGDRWVAMGEGTGDAGGEEQEEAEEIPEGLFDVIELHEDKKSILMMGLRAERPVHTLISIRKPFTMHDKRCGAREVQGDPFGGRPARDLKIHGADGP